MEQQVIDSLRLVVTNLLHMQNISIQYGEQELQDILQCSWMYKSYHRGVTTLGRKEEQVHLHARLSYAQILPLRISNTNLYFWDKWR